MGTLCEGRACAVTGAARGIGRAHVEALVAAGARVVVNDVDGRPWTRPPLCGLRRRGGRPRRRRVGGAAGADGLLGTALDTWGRLDVVVNNAGIARDRMIVNLPEDDWDAVVRVHLKATFLVTQRAARHWRERSRAGDPVDARVVNTVSSVGLYGHAGQSNYGAAKAAIALRSPLPPAWSSAATAPPSTPSARTALTPMTEAVGLGDTEDARAGALDPRWVSPRPRLARLAPVGRRHRPRDRRPGKRLAAEGLARGRRLPVAAAADVDAAIRSLLDAADPNADVQGDISR